MCVSTKWPCDDSIWWYEGLNNCVCHALNTCDIVVDVEIKEQCNGEVCCENEEFGCLVHESGGVLRCRIIRWLGNTNDEGVVCM
jgi:hypothetical protein